MYVLWSWKFNVEERQSNVKSPLYMIYMREALLSDSFHVAIGGCFANDAQKFIPIAGIKQTAFTAQLKQGPFLCHSPLQSRGRPFPSSHSCRRPLSRDSPHRCWPSSRICPVLPYRSDAPSEPGKCQRDVPGIYHRQSCCQTTDCSRAVLKQFHKMFYGFSPIRSTLIALYFYTIFLIWINSCFICHFK